jgi:phosphatidylglycerophosphatase A
VSLQRQQDQESHPHPHVLPQTRGDRLVLFIATGFGVGYAKKAPGTWGSIVGLPFAVGLAACDLSVLLKGVILFVVIQFGFCITARTEAIWKTHDDQRIVIDEVVGQMLTLAWFQPSIMTTILGLGLFRLFDIWKPGPIGWVDRDAPGAWGTFYDDVLAGLCGAAVLYCIYYFGYIG